MLKKIGLFHLATWLIVPLALGTPNPSVCSRSYDVQRGLVEQLRNKKCEEITDADLLSIDRLTFDSYHVPGVPSQIKRSDFSGLKNVTALSYGFVYFDPNWAPDVFGELTSLNELILEGDGFGPAGTMAPDLFSGLSNLRTVYIDGDQVSRLSPDIFKSSPQLETLILVGPSPAPWPVGVLSPLASLKRLEMRTSGSWSGIPAEAFSNLKQLNQLTLSTATSTQYAKDLLSGLGELKTLEIGGEYDALPKGFFGGLANLSVGSPGTELEFAL